MTRKLVLLAVSLCSVAISLLAGCSDDGTDGTNTADQVVSLSYLASTESRGFDGSAAEIVTFDAAHEKMFVVNADNGQVDVFGASDVTSPVLEETIDIQQLLVDNGVVASVDVVGAVNSVALSGNLVAVAVEADPKTDAGWVIIINATTFAYIDAVQVGALPDMLTFTPDGSKIVVANEGEPDEGYVHDPEGSVSIIAVADYSVTNVSFAPSDLPVDYTDTMIIDGVGASVAQSLEPEYITVSADSSMAYVVLQENNAIAAIDLSDNRVDSIFGLGFKNHSIPGNEIDASQKDGVNIQSLPVMGMYMPDAITSYTIAGKTYLITANEGDSRQDWLNSVSDQTACEAAGYFYDGADLDGDTDTLCIDEFSAKDFYDDDNVTLVDSEGELLFATNGGFGEDNELRRLKFSYFTTVAMNGGTEFEKLYAYGARSFSIWDAETGKQVFDSGSDFEVITAQIFGEDFNNDNAENSGDDRSDNKGPEPEGVTVGVINGHTYAFIGLERMGGVMVYDVSNPYAPEYVMYTNNRDGSYDIKGIADLETATDVITAISEAGDLGPEGLTFVSATDSPNGMPLVLVANEVSGTVAVYQIDVTLLEQ